MKKILNDALMPLVSEGKLSVQKVNDLIQIKEFVDRVSTKKYLVPETIDSLIQRFGQSPDVVTWGDYFQTDLAMAAINTVDEEFSRIVDTVRFDIIASWDIFSNSAKNLEEWVRETSQVLWLSGKDEALYDENDKEISHLKILLDYYHDLGLNGNFYESELIWYHSYFENAATGTESCIIH
jgi:hypothetical protein